MDEPIEEVYFNWLYSKVASVEVPTPSLTYLTLMHTLHTTEFVWVNPFDENRAADGLGLRHEFYNQIHEDIDLAWMHIGCSVLEMLIPLARRAEFDTDIPMRDWFWTFLKNLGIDEMNDATPNVKTRVDPVLEKLIWRRYRRDGLGGLFPLSRPMEDQREVEIWYQFCAYLTELEEDGRL